MSSMQLRRSVMSFVLVFILSIIGFVAQANEINVIQLDSFPARTQVTIEFQVQLPETLPPNVTRFGTQVRLGVAQLATTLSDDPDTMDLVSDPTFSPLQFNLAVSQLPDTGESPLWRTILILVGAGALIIGLTLISLRLRRLLVVALLAAGVILSLVFITSAQESSNSLTAILIDDFLCNDINDDGFAGPNEIICYTLILRNLGDTALSQINGELLDLSFDGNISIVPDSIEIGAFIPLDPNVNETENNPPADDNETENNTSTDDNKTENNTPTPPIDADAGDDAFTVTNGASSTNDVLANDEGDAPLNVLSFGDSLANVGTTPADGVTELVLAAGGGTVNITIDASGNINIDATTATSTGSVSIFYEIQAGNNTTDIGQVDISYGDFPSATDDTLTTLGLLNIYVTDVGVTLNVGAGTGVMNNDTLGTPAATLVNWGGGDASPSVNRLPGSSRSFAGGTLTVNADGSFDLINPTSAGVFTFDYILENTVGTSQATVEIYVAEAPTAVDDNYAVSLGSVDSSNNVTDNDDLGTPPAEVDFYADENDIGGTSQVASPVTYTHPTGNFTVTIDSAGNLTIDASVGGVVEGSYSFDYQLTNSAGSSTPSGTVTVDIVSTPTTQDDDFTVILPNNLSGDLTANNGNGPDTAGVPAFTSLTFGDGSLTGTFTGGDSVGLAGGTLTVNNDGTITLNGATTTGTYTFDYQLTNANGSSNSSTVTIEVQQAPSAVADALTASVGIVNNYPASTLFNDNGSGSDDLGVPIATIVNFGGGSITGSTAVTDFAFNTTTGAGTFAGGTLTVNDDGSVVIDSPTTPGTVTFEYRTDNGVGFSDAIVTVNIVEGPIAENDLFGVKLGNDLIGADLLADNGNGVDQSGTPAFDLLTFGAGDLLGTITSNTATGGGTSVGLAGGTLTVRSDGTLDLVGATTAGTYTFDYRLESTSISQSDDATVTIVVDTPPTVTSTTPLDTATNVTTNTTIDITFSENVNITGDWITIVCGTSGTFNNTNGNIGVTPATGPASSFVVTPTGGFDPAGEDCTVTLNATLITDDDTHPAPTEPATSDQLDGNSDNTGGDNYTFSFTTADIAPQVTNAQVEQGNTLGALTTGIDNNTNIALTFSEQVNFGVSAYNVTCTSSGDVTTSYSASATPATSVTLTYSGTGLDSGETCTLTLESTLITDNDAIDPPNELDGDASNDTTDGDADDYTFNFTVDTAPSITSIQVEKSDTLGDITTPSNDTDVDLDTTIVITFSETVTGSNDWVTLTCAPSSDTFNPTGSAGAGILGVAGNGTATITLTPPANFTPNDTCTVTVVASEINDGDAGDPPAGLASDYSDTFTLVNQVAPTANDDAFSVALGSPLNLPAGTLFNDNSSGADDLGIPAATLVSFGGGNTTAPTDATDHPAGATDGLAGGTLQVNADGSLSLTGATTAGTYTFLYRLTNAAGSNDATVTVTIQTPPNGFDDSSTGVLGGTSAPSDAFHVAQNAPAANIANLYVDNGGFGTDELGVPSAPIDAPADVINTITLNGSPDAATGTIGGGAITIGVDGTISVATNGDLTFEPPTGFVGLATFDYTLANSIGTDATPATVTIAVGNRPTCAVDAYTGTANINLSANVATGVLANDTGDDITVTQSMGSAVNVGSAVGTTNSGSVTLNADGSFDYSPPAGVSGVNVDSFTYAIDNSFGEVTTNCTVNITLNTDAGAIPWFIERGAVGTNNGTFANPFNSIASFNAANTNTGNNPGTGDVVYVYADVPGFYNEADGLNLLDAQKIYGGTVQFDSVFTASGLVSSAYTTFASTAEGARTEIRTTGDDAFDIFSNNIIQGFTIDSTAGYAFADSGVSIGTTTISDVSTFNNGGVFNLQNGGTLNATLDRMSASTTGSLSVIRLNGINGTITDTIAGGIIHNGSGNMFDIRNGTVSVTVSSPVTMLNTATGIGIFMSNADGTYNFLSNSVDIGSGSGGINIENGSDGTLNITNTGSQIQGIQGIPFRINNSAMNVDYNGAITHRQGTTPSSLMTARVVEIIGGTGIISFDGNVIHGDNITRGTAETVFMSNTGVGNTVSFNYIDSITTNTSAFFSNTSGNVAVNRLRSNCQGDLTIAGNTHCIQISDTTSSGFTIEALAVDTDDGGENGGAISLVNAPGIWTIEDITAGLRGRFQTLVFGNNFGTLNIATVNSGTSPGAPAVGNLSSDNGGTIDLTNGTVNINVNNLESFNGVDHGINLVDVGGPLFRVSGSVVVDSLAGANENIFIENVTVPTIDIGTDGTTNNTVSVTNRRTFGISATRSGTATALRFGDLQIPNPHSVPETQINPTPVPTWITFNSLTP